MLFCCYSDNRKNLYGWDFYFLIKMRIVPSKMASKFYQNFIKILMKFNINLDDILEGKFIFF